MLTDQQIEMIIKRIMARRNAGSGLAIFVDPVILRQILMEESAR